jgi:hypothetical protein
MMFLLSGEAIAIQDVDSYRFEDYHRLRRHASFLSTLFDKASYMPPATSGRIPKPNVTAAIPSILVHNTLTGALRFPTTLLLVTALL